MVTSWTSRLLWAGVAVMPVALSATPARAAPPPSCVQRFVGVWRHEGGGSSNIAQLTPDGTAACSGNAFCQPGTWTFDGNALTYNNGMYDTVYTLVSPNLMIGGGGKYRVTRIGGAPALGDTAGGDEQLREALSWMRAARAAGQYCTSANQIKASEDYDKAADAFAQAGDAGRQAMAHELALKADRKADECRLGLAGRRGAPRPASGDAADGETQEACDRVQQQMNALAQSGDLAGEDAIYKQARSMCNLKLHRAKAPLKSLTE